MVNRVDGVTMVMFGHQLQTHAPGGAAAVVSGVRSPLACCARWVGVPLVLLEVVRDPALVARCRYAQEASDSGKVHSPVRARYAAGDDAVRAVWVLLIGRVVLHG